MNIRTIIVKTLATIGIKRNKTIIPIVTKEDLNLTDSVEPIEKEGVDGNITLEELTIISQLVKQNKPKTIFEIGTFNGRTTLNLDFFSPPDATVYTLDLPKKDIDESKFEIEKGDGKYVDKNIIGEKYQKKVSKVIQLYGDSATFDFTPYYGKIDFVFVDGAHSAPYVKSDTETAFKLVSPNGIILWHDYGVWRDVIKVLNTYYKIDMRFKSAKHIKGTSFVYCGTMSNYGAK